VYFGYDYNVWIGILALSLTEKYFKNKCELYSYLKPNSSKCEPFLHSCYKCINSCLNQIFINGPKMSSTSLFHLKTTLIADDIIWKAEWMQILGQCDLLFRWLRDQWWQSSLINVQNSQLWKFDFSCDRCAPLSTFLFISFWILSAFSHKLSVI
jgi:hypothetical protein